MKKFIALLLALLMTFSVATVAFAAEETVPETTPEAGTSEEIDLGEFQWILDLPLWTAKPLLKVAKIALKFVKVYLKISAVFNNIPDEVVDGVEQAIKDIIAKNEKPETAPAAIA
ncbi:MAG: hypothetical protein II356_03885 [Clostridia bacterium]|jgi:hypothetical protein|nr:hypothetical protein [Clostridia bacterium]MBQ1994818.1 hypothetical protein [Clostridia bacterium]